MRVTSVRLKDFSEWILPGLYSAFRSPPKELRWVLIKSAQDAEGWLIIGDVMSHSTLLMLGLMADDMRTSPDSQERKRFLTNLTNPPSSEEEPQAEVCGGGFCDGTGQISLEDESAWVTISFKKETPRELRHVIQQRLNHHVPHFFGPDEHS